VATIGGKVVGLPRGRMLETTCTENLAMIGDTPKAPISARKWTRLGVYVRRREHFFDGVRANGEYALG